MFPSDLNAVSALPERLDGLARALGDEGRTQLTDPALRSAIVEEARRVQAHLEDPSARAALVGVVLGALGRTLGPATRNAFERTIVTFADELVAQLQGGLDAEDFASALFPKATAPPTAERPVLPRVILDPTRFKAGVDEGDSRPLGERMRELAASLQGEICGVLEALDGVAHFREDPWSHPVGGGGLTRVLERGAVFEKAAVLVSSVRSELEDSTARRMPGEGQEFSVEGLSVVLHPFNPMVPSFHLNIHHMTRGSQSWFSGGADLTPYYLFDEDARHFHRVLKTASDE